MALKKHHKWLIGSFTSLILIFMVTMSIFTYMLFIRQEVNYNTLNKEIYDGAQPSGNSIALINLLRLEKLTANHDLGVKAKSLVQAFSKTVQEVPSGFTQFLAGFHFMNSPSTELLIVGDPNAPDTLEMLSVIRENFYPQVTTLLKDSHADGEKLARLAPFTSQYTSTGNKATAYVCRDYSCESPTTDAKYLQQILNNEKPDQKG